jgi:5-formyltetrahydrofolate cyclo-ligase
MTSNHIPPTRLQSRQRLLIQRQQFSQNPLFQSAAQALHQHLEQVLRTLEPDCLGVYWPLPGEFNAATDWAVGENDSVVRLALPCTQKSPPAMHYLAWDGQPPNTLDEHAIPTASGGPVVPDVLLVPCVGYTAAGHRLGYGGGYFDRYLAAHPDITTIGVAWSVGQISSQEFGVQDHDKSLMLVVTESGVVGC